MVNAVKEANDEYYHSLYLFPDPYTFPEGKCLHPLNSRSIDQHYAIYAVLPLPILINTILYVTGKCIILTYSLRIVHNYDANLTIRRSKFPHR